MDAYTGVQMDVFVYLHTHVFTEHHNMGAFPCAIQSSELSLLGMHCISLATLCDLISRQDLVRSFSTAVP